MAGPASAGRSKEGSALQTWLRRHVEAAQRQDNRSREI